LIWLGLTSSNHIFGGVSLICTIVVREHLTIKLAVLDQVLLIHHLPVVWNARCLIALSWNVVVLVDLWLLSALNIE
jgi:hypothetical protein